MAAPPTKKVVSVIGMDGSIPRMGLNIPVPSATKPPPTPVSTKPAAGTKLTK